MAVIESDVSAWLTMHGYTISASGDLTTAQVTLCLTDISAEVTIAAARFALIAGYTLNTAFKDHITLKGSVAQALYAIMNKGVSSGLAQDRIIVSRETADKYWADYEKGIDDMKNGWRLGA